MRVIALPAPTVPAPAAPTALAHHPAGDAAGKGADADPPVVRTGGGFMVTMAVQRTGTAISNVSGDWRAVVLDRNEGANRSVSGDEFAPRGPEIDPVSTLAAG